MSSQKNSFLFQHKWTIHNVGHFLTGQSLFTLNSECFPPKCSEFQFSLQLLPNYVQQGNSFMSTFLRLEGCAENLSLNARYRIAIVDQDYVKEGTSTFTQGNCRGFTTFISVATLQKLINQFNDSLSIVCQLEIDNYHQHQIIQCSNSSSVVSVNEKTIKFGCKWILDDFSLLYCKNRDRDKVSLRLKNFSLPEYEDLRFYLVLVMTNDDENLRGSACKKSIASFLYFESESVQKVMVHYRISILNWKGKPYVTGEGQGKMFSNEEGRGATNFISCDELFDLRRGLLPEDKLIITAQVEILDLYTTMIQGHKKSRQDFVHKTEIIWQNKTSDSMDRFIHSNFRPKQIIEWNDIHLAERNLYSSYCKTYFLFNKCDYGHLWSVDNYGYFYFEGHNSPTMIQSNAFPCEAAKDNVQFCLRLYPNTEKRKEEEGKFISLYLHLLAGPDTVSVKCKFYLVNFLHLKIKVQEIKGMLTKDKPLGIDEFVTNDCTLLHKYGLMQRGMTIACEVTIMDAPNESWNPWYDLKKKEYRCKSVWDASEYVLKHEHQWRIPQYKLMHQHNICASSDSFAIDNLDDLKFCLKLWPKGKINNDDNNLDLFVQLFDCQTEKQVNSFVRFSIRDYESKLRYPKWIYGQLTNVKGLGCERYIGNDFLFENESQLLPDNNLLINCQIEVFKKYENEIVKEASCVDGENSQSNSNHLVMNSIQSMNITNSIVIFDSNCSFNGNISLSYKE